ncbi:MAG: hypothetical protein O2960_29485 [Verrucomicrobia bacterium]|nr:hypothetical protein [Verrucomicrobiota bacterium]
MSYRRYEIILPIRYNDGALIERSKYWETVEEIVARFGALTVQPDGLQGIWLHESKRYQEENVRIFIDVEDSPENGDFFRQLKQTLKTRFQQIDIWIVSFEIRIT